MDQSNRHRPAGPPARATARVWLTLLAAILITALSAAHADATIAARTTVKRKTTKATVTTKPTVTTTVATTVPTTAATASKASACDLLTAGEAAVVVNASHLVANAGSNARGCVYLDGVGIPRVLISITPGFETRELFVSSRSWGSGSSRAIPLAGLGDLAYRSADWSQIEFLKGKIAVLIVMNVIDANGTSSGPDQTKALDAARVAASRA